MTHAFFCDGTPDIICYECKVLHFIFRASILCQSEICVGLHQYWTANLAVAAATTFVIVAVVDDAMMMTLISPIPVGGSVASGMQCLFNTPKMLMVN